MYVCVLLKEKLRPIKTVEFFLSKNLFESGSTKLEVIQRLQMTGVQGETFIEKR